MPKILYAKVSHRSRNTNEQRTHSEPYPTARASPYGKNQERPHTSTVTLIPAHGASLLALGYPTPPRSPKPEVHAAESVPTPPLVLPSPYTDRVRRPPNAFVLFRQQFCVQLKRGDLHAADCHGLDGSAISKRAGEMWNELSDEDKLPYQAAALRIKEQHFLSHPNYRYAPSRKGVPIKAPRKRNAALRALTGRTHTAIATNEATPEAVDHSLLIEPESPQFQPPTPPNTDYLPLEVDDCRTVGQATPLSEPLLFAAGHDPLSWPEDTDQSPARPPVTGHLLDADFAYPEILSPSEQPSPLFMAEGLTVEPLTFAEPSADSLPAAQSMLLTAEDADLAQFFNLDDYYGQ